MYAFDISGFRAFESDDLDLVHRARAEAVSYGWDPSPIYFASQNVAAFGYAA